MVYTNTPDTGIDLSVNKIEGEVEKDTYNRHIKFTSYVASLDQSTTRSWALCHLLWPNAFGAGLTNWSCSRRTQENLFPHFDRVKSVLADHREGIYRGRISFREKISFVKLVLNLAVRAEREKDAEATLKSTSYISLSNSCCANQFYKTLYFF